MNDADRAEALDKLARLELRAIEDLIASHEKLHDILNALWEQVGLPPHSFETPGVDVTRFTNQVRERLIELEPAE